MKRSCLPRAFWIIVSLIFSFLVILLAIIVLEVPKLAADTFGPASASLNKVEQVYWGVILLIQKDSLTSPQTSSGEEIPFQIELGETAFSISQRLREMGLIDNPGSFRDYLVYSGLDKRIQAGNYLLNPMMSPIEIALEIQDATPEFIDFIVLAGWRSEEIAQAIPYSGFEFSPETFLEFVYTNDVEGYLFPGSYTFPRDTDAETLVTTLINAFEVSLTEEMRSGFSTQGLSTHEAVILASIIEREAVVEDEMPLIASVFLNRLNSGMLLNADPTVQFALGYNHLQGTWWTNPLSNADLAVNSPYNSYLHRGLPPGPISNPGFNALKAVAFPAQTPYLYFRVSCDGSNRHNFAETLEEHVNNACP